jgi:hypothetical protein
MSEFDQLFPSLENFLEEGNAILYFSFLQSTVVSPAAVHAMSLDAQLQ